jgi:aminomethyltransferase
MQRLIPDKADLSSVLFGGAFNADIAGHPCFITRCGYTGEDGFEINCPKHAAPFLWQHILANDEVRLAGLGARDMLRMEAGLCLYGFELSSTITPPEAGLSWTVGAARRAEGAAPFLGSDIILAQLKDRTLVKSLRCGMISEGPPARAGADITTLEGEVVGTVTSGCSSPCLGKNIAMGTVTKPHNRRETELQVVVRGKSYPAKVTGLPFVPTSYYKGL